MRALVLAASACCAAAASPSLLMTFLGYDGTCGAPSAPARFYAATIALNASTAPAWVVSSPAPLEIDAGLVCAWCKRPAVDRVTGRVWYVSGGGDTCGNSSLRVAVEWAFGAATAPPTYTGACSFKAAFTPAQRPVALPLFAYDRRVFADGPYLVDDTGTVVVGVAVPPDPGGAARTLDSLPPCAAVVVSSIAPNGTAHGVLAADDDAAGGAAPAPPMIVHAVGDAYAAGGPRVNVSGVSPVTGVVEWATTAPVPTPPGLRFHGWHEAVVHRGVFLATSPMQPDRGVGPEIMYRGDGLTSGGAATLTWLPMRSVVAYTFGPWGAWTVNEGSWPLYVAQMSDWYTYVRYESWCQPFYSGPWASVTLTELVNASTAVVVSSARIMYCPLQGAAAACDHAAAVLLWRD